MELQQLKETFDELGRAFEEFKTANDQRIKQLEEKGHVDPTVEAKVNKANEDVARLTEQRDTLTRRIDQFETRMQRPGAGGGTAVPQEVAEYKAAFNKYLRRGIPVAEVIQEKLFQAVPELKALSVGSQPEGGYWVEPETSQRMITQIFETSPIRPLVTVETIGTDALEIPEDLNEAASGGWVSEQGTRGETGTPNIGLRRIPVHEQFAQPKATQQLLDDAAVNVEAWLSRKVADKLGRTENTAFINGTGVGQPRGLLTHPAGTTNPGQIEQINSGDASLVTGDGLIKVFYALKDPYAARATWAMKRNTVQAVRLLTDSGTPGQYIWQPGLQGGEPDLLLGRPIARFEDMPVVAANALAIAIADWREAYTIVDRQGIRTIRDIFTSKPFVKFYTTKRVGGDVTNFEAIKIQKIAA